MHRASISNIGPRYAFVSITSFVEHHNICPKISLNDVLGWMPTAARGQDVESMQKSSAQRASLEMAFSDAEAVPVYIINTCFDVREQGTREGEDEITLPAGAADTGLSVRALNVLKILADEITGEIAARDAWVPSDALLRKITMERLSLARNCGPRTVDEIVRWAAARGVTIRPLFHAGKSLAEAWRDLGARFSAGELTKEELTEALEKSVRRKSTKIPVGVQRILLQYLRGAAGGTG
jgi:hypothetical protein